MWDQYVYDSPGEAAQTGSLLHAGAEEFHRTGDLISSLERLRRDMSKFPLADYERAKRMFDGYSADSRNNVRIPIDRLEKRYTETIDPHPTDLTKEPIYITGQLDQLRVSLGLTELILHDIKSSQRPASTVNIESSIQLWFYIWLARKQGLPVNEYKLIMTQEYLRKAGPNLQAVFVDGLPYSEKNMGHLIQDIRLYTALIRNRQPVPIGPGEHCNWCPFNNPYNCLQKRG